MYYLDLLDNQISKIQTIDLEDCLC